MGGAINAVGREAAAKQRLVGAVDGIVQTGMAIRQDRIERDTEADLLNFKSFATDAEHRLKQKLDSILPADGVDIEAEVQAARKEYESELADWVGTKGNVTHAQKQKDFIRRNQEISVQAQRMALEQIESKQKTRRVGAGQRGIELGIQLGDEELIAESVRALHVEGVRGYQSSGEVESMVERHTDSMKQFQDRQRMDEFEEAKLNGDWDAAKEIVNSMEGRGWTEEKKRSFYRQERSRAAYSETALAIQQAASIGELNEIRKQVEESKGLTAQNRPVLMRSVNAQLARIERAQLSNAQRLLRTFEQGKGDWSEFDKLKDLDTEDGLPPDAERVLKPLLESKETQVEQATEFKRDEQSLIFGRMMDELAAERFGETSTGRIDRNAPEGERITKARKEQYEEMLGRIEAVPLGTIAKAKLMEEWLQVRATDLITPGEEKFGRWYNRGREFSEEEQNLRGQVLDGYRAMLSNGDVPEGFGRLVQEDDSRIAEFFRAVRNPSPEQLDRLRGEIMAPILGAAARKKARGEARGRGQGEAIQINSSADFDALEPGSTFIYNGRIGVKQ